MTSSNLDWEGSFGCGERRWSEAEKEVTRWWSAEAVQVVQGGGTATSPNGGLV
jgi:hypothetical protein